MIYVRLILHFLSEICGGSCLRYAAALEVNAQVQSAHSPSDPRP